MMLLVGDECGVVAGAGAAAACWSSEGFAVASLRDRGQGSAGSEAAVALLRSRAAIFEDGGMGRIGTGRMGFDGVGFDWQPSFLSRRLSSSFSPVPGETAGGKERGKLGTWCA